MTNSYDVKKRILIVDDDAESSLLLKQDLDKFDAYEIFQETSGRKAMETIKSVRPHLVLLDVMIPDMDGPSIARQIEKEYQYSIRIVFISSIAGFEEANRGAVGPYPFITKNATAAQIKVIFDKIFNG
jgi:CheY-like chemotaxis protein